MANDIHQLLGHSLAASSEYYARFAQDSATNIEPYSVSFLRRARIYRLERALPQKPVVLYAGMAPDELAYILSGTPENFVKLCQADGIVIGSSDLAVTYVSTFLDVTRSMDEMFYVVDSVDEIKFQPDLNAEKARVKRAIIERYRSVLVPPAAQAEGGDYVVVAFAVREQRLEKLTLRSSTAGDITSATAVIEDNLPLVYGL